jgi:hypothetical protein
MVTGLTILSTDAVRPCGEPVRGHALPPNRPQQASAPGDLTRHLVEFGHDRPLETSRAIVRRAFDLGATHFRLANNCGLPYGSAEQNVGVGPSYPAGVIVPKRPPTLSSDSSCQVCGPAVK